MQLLENIIMTKKMVSAERKLPDFITHFKEKKEKKHIMRLFSKRFK